MGCCSVDQGIAMFEMARKARKWTHVFYYNLFDIAMNNAFILAQESSGNDLKLRDFRLSVAKSLIGRFTARTKPGPKPAPVLRELRFMQDRPHLIERIPEIKKGRLCACGCRKKSLYRCSSCQVTVSFKCFKKYHSRQRRRPGM